MAPRRDLPTVPRVVAIVAVLLAALLTACSEDEGDGEAGDFIQREDSRLVKVQTVGLAAFGPINPHTAAASDATAAFGEPSSTRPTPAERRGALCVWRWRDLGLTIDFEPPTDTDPCGADAGIERIRVAGPAAVEAGWRTAEGIRPGMRVAAARRIYPEARRSADRLILVEGPGDGETVTVLAVRTAARQVTEMRFPIAE